MQSFAFELEYYIVANGKQPFKEWLYGLKDINARAKVRVRLDRVRLGNLGKNRSVGAGVYELKIDYGPGYRVYFARKETRIILLLLGGDKTSQTRDILLAKEFWKECNRRKKHGKTI